MIWKNIALALVMMIVSIIFVAPSQAQVTQREDQLRTCTEILKDRPAGAECSKIFPKDADCCIQYSPERLAKLCAKMSNIENTLTCFSEIHQVGFWKRELLPENEPGLANRYSEAWTRSVMIHCSKEPTKSEALSCALAQKASHKMAFKHENDQIARQLRAADPIMQFCRKALGEYWEGVEQCIKDQNAAKKRLGL
ncbi:hypothetical protein [Rhizobium rhizoryzae]|uniref:hypothetical protein n=1 Tax=Rhizobium rhizoryzae TaxID=451876 RepID=UPI0028AE9D4C|nr:hypothetical protein [Rhizobium rhizoryzae]